MMQTNSELQCYNRKGIESEKKKVYQTPLVLVLLCVYDKELPLDIYKKTCKLQTEYVNAKYLPTLFPPSLFFFSSPEHNVLRGSYCDRSSSGVRPSVCPSVHLSVRPLTISLKIFSSKTRRPILIKLGRNVPWVKLYKKC